MPLVFKTQDDSVSRVDIAGVGILGPNAKGGVEVSKAAASMSELQDEKGEPLKGSALTTAAKEWAEARGLQAVNVPEAKLADLPQEYGAVPDRPPLEEVSKEAYKRTYGGLETVNDQPEDPVQVAGEPEVGGPAVPDSQREED